MIFFSPYLEKKDQNVLNAKVSINNNEVLINDIDVAVDLYDWVNDAVIKYGMLEDQDDVNEQGRELERIADYLYDQIEK